MASTHRGKVERDVRDSVPGWTPFVAPQAPDCARTPFESGLISEVLAEWG